MTSGKNEKEKTANTLLFITALAAAFLAISAGEWNPLWCQTEELPKAEKILDGYIEAMGGKEASSKFFNRIEEGTLEFSPGGITGTLSLYTARPDKSLMIINLESIGMGRILGGSDGKVAWALHPTNGPRLKEGKEKENALRDGIFDAIVHWRKVYKKVECTGIEKVSDTPCYKVIVTPFKGDPIARFFDIKTNLCLKIAAMAEGKVISETYLSDFKKVDGILQPFKVVTKSDGQEFIFTVKSIKHNVEMPKDRFDLPKEIQALLPQTVDKDKGKK